MKNLESQVDRLAHLARLEFTAEEKAGMVKDMEKILRFIDKIEELDLQDVEPQVYMTEERTVLRKDEVKQTISRDDALKNAPDKDTDYFRVPKVVKRSGE